MFLIALVTAALFVLTFSGKGARKKLDAMPTWLLVLAAVLPLFALARAGLGAVAGGIGMGLAVGRQIVGLISSRESTPRGETASTAGGRPRGMTRAEALEVLGLKEGASRQEILDEYRRLMKRVHPDRGGSEYLATRLNQAKDVLLGS